MDGPSVPRPDLTRAEWTLVAELVRQEVQDLPAEIHHTDSRDYRDDLHARREALARLLAKVEAALGA